MAFFFTIIAAQFCTGAKELAGRICRGRKKDTVQGRIRRFAMELELKRIFPAAIRQELSDGYENGLEEVRFRVGRPTEFLYADGKIRRLSGVEQKEVLEMLNYISGYSLYALEEELRQGFLTMRGGHRVGITGRAETCRGSGKISAISDVGGMNIRVAHERKNCAAPLIPFLRDGASIHNTLILAPPGAGKTTYLRDCIRLLSEGDAGHEGLKIGLVDERSEIAACYRGVPQNDLGPRVDVLDNCPKEKGMRMLLRTMSPQVIAVDELGGEGDFSAVYQILYSGVRLLASVHAKEKGELEAKPFLKNLIGGKQIGRIVVLKREEGGTRRFEIYDGALERIC